MKIIMSSSYMCFVLDNNLVVIISLLLLNYRWNAFIIIVVWTKSFRMVHETIMWHRIKTTKFSAFPKAYHCDVEKNPSGT